MENYTNNVIENVQTNIKERQRVFLQKVFMWMTAALCLSGITAMWTASNPTMVKMLFSNKVYFFGLIFGELGLVFFISSSLKKLSSLTTVSLFIVYSLVNGLTLSVIFLVYSKATIASTFFITAGTFGAMSLYGFFTKKDLFSWGNIFFMGIIGLIIATGVNLFLHSEMLYWLISYVGVIVFMGLTAYDAQKIKTLALGVEENSAEEKKLAISGALCLYLDFINLFLYLLRIFGRRD